ncbi:hypothetical protein QAD02_007225 [Eretmocerus hayati]|uniref:Uncharacterized protein n=1 Tax=Eretmocerus hayati TaxID=131215 RepID=A0ACC2N3M0_9HYME|nr:hypothetical protein QAD02_007225 [Eretmocerus hayati]
MPFGAPMVWGKPALDHNDCYFCNSQIDGYNRNNRKLIKYPNSTSSCRPLPQGPDLPIPMAPWMREDIPDGDRDSGNESCDFAEFSGDNPGAIPALRLFDQESLNDMVRDLGLTKEKAELFGSRLQERPMLAPGTTFCQYCYREKEFAPFFTQKNSLIYCNDVSALMALLGPTTKTTTNKLLVLRTRMKK